MASTDRRPSLVVIVVVVVAVIVVASALVRFVIGTIFGALRLLAVVAVAGVVIALLVGRRGDDP